ncbi:aspartic peptidase domain-containing protein [Favolaschia claudopus]|uniref:Aspartic peptidase domain-containing protein n=1 Tax=Favolaschia claudopus TaxID=2862362 RepID=A0AAW0E4D2_9AGAR
MPCASFTAKFTIPSPSREMLLLEQINAALRYMASQGQDLSSEELEAFFVSGEENSDERMIEDQTVARVPEAPVAVQRSSNMQQPMSRGLPGSNLPPVPPVSSQITSRNHRYFPYARTARNITSLNRPGAVMSVFTEVPAGTSAGHNDGPALALPPDRRTGDQWLDARAVLERRSGCKLSLGLLPGLLSLPMLEGHPVINVTIGNRNDLMQQRTYPMMLDLGSSHTWLFGPNCYDDLMGVKLFNPEGSKTCSNVSIGNHEKNVIAGYVGGSRFVYDYTRDHVLFHFDPDQDPRKRLDKAAPWLHMKFGIVTQIEVMQNAEPGYSGVIGLCPPDRETCLDNAVRESFLTQLQEELKSPEFTLMITRTEGTITFGDRVSYISDQVWHNNIPLVSTSFPREPTLPKLPHSARWCVSKPWYRINEMEYGDPGGSILFDSGCAGIFLKAEIVKMIYDYIKSKEGDDSVYIDLKRPERSVPVEGGRYLLGDHYIRKDLAKKKLVYLELPIGDDPDSVFDLRVLCNHQDAQPFAPEDSKHEYIIGTIQPKELLIGVHGSDYYRGPDILGRAGLATMELVCQFPRSSSHSISWRTKAIPKMDPKLPVQEESI